MKNENKKIYENVDELLKDLLDYNCVINVRSEQEAIEFVRVMRDRFDMGWNNRSCDTWYYEFEEDTCYSFEYKERYMYYGSIMYYQHNYNKTIIPYSEVRELLLSNDKSKYDNFLLRLKMTNALKSIINKLDNMKNENSNIDSDTLMNEIESLLLNIGIEFRVKVSDMDRDDENSIRPLKSILDDICKCWNECECE